ncbi:MAG: sigma-70 family RNA polymerase sigma factor [Verrucomicrobia bacterium]|nr:sigma-70 family RNA polymerase sigma factor [Verrucomicrobiota bacterium]
MYPSDEELIAGCHQGDTASFDQLFERYRSRVFTFVWRYVRDRETAEDIFQETFVRVFARAGTYRKRAKVSTWIYTIAANLCRDELRRRRRRPLVSLDGPLPGDEPGQVWMQIVSAPDAPTDSPRQAAQDAEHRTALWRAVDGLPSELRVTLELQALHGLKYREVAEVLGIPLGTVQSRIHNAIKLLRKAFRDEAVIA